MRGQHVLGAGHADGGLHGLLDWPHLRCGTVRRSLHSDGRRGLRPLHNRLHGPLQLGLDVHCLVHELSSRLILCRGRHGDKRRCLHAVRERHIRVHSNFHFGRSEDGLLQNMLCLRWRAPCCQHPLQCNDRRDLRVLVWLRRQREHMPRRWVSVRGGRDVVYKWHGSVRSLLSRRPWTAHRERLHCHDGRGSRRLRCEYLLCLGHHGKFVRCVQELLGRIHGYSTRLHSVDRHSLRVLGGVHDERRFLRRHRLSVRGLDLERNGERAL